MQNYSDLLLTWLLLVYINLYNLLCTGPVFVEIEISASDIGYIDSEVLKHN